MRKSITKYHKPVPSQILLFKKIFRSEGRNWRSKKIFFITGNNEASSTGFSGSGL